LFAFSFVVYLFCAIVILLLFTRSTIRKHLLLIFGFLLPHLLTLSIAYLNDSTRELWNYYYLSNLSFERTRFVDSQTLLTLAALPIFYFAISLFMLNRDARFSKYQSQILQTVLLWLLFSVLFVFYAKDLRPQTLIVFIPGVSLLLTHFFLLIRRKKFIHLNSWVLLVGIITIAYLARFGKIPSVDYSNLVVRDNPGQVTNKRILVLSDNVDVYRANYLATPFLNWRLSEEIFRNPDYYNNVTRVYRSFKSDPPDIIYDRENLLQDFFYRIPEIGSGYVRQGELYTRRINN
jgi:hypothetical protein